MNRASWVNANEQRAAGAEAFYGHCYRLRRAGWLPKERRFLRPEGYLMLRGFRIDGIFRRLFRIHSRGPALADGTLGILKRQEDPIIARKGTLVGLNRLMARYPMQFTSGGLQGTGPSNWQVNGLKLHTGRLR